MMNFAQSRVLAATALIVTALLPLSAARGQGKIVSEGVEAAAKQILRRGGSEGAEQLAKFGEAVEARAHRRAGAKGATRSSPGSRV